MRWAGRENGHKRDAVGVGSIPMWRALFVYSTRRCRMINIRTCSFERLMFVINRAREHHVRLIAQGNYAAAAGVAKFLSIAVAEMCHRMIGGA